MRKLLVYIDGLPTRLKICSADYIFDATIAGLAPGAAWMETDISRVVDAPPYNPDLVTIVPGEA